MTFPVYVSIGSLQIHPHLLFESLAYFLGFRLYLYLRRRNPQQMSKQHGLFLLAGTIVGAALGSKVLYWFEDPQLTLQNWNNIVYLMEGKSIVGGLLGGLLGVEWVKKRIGWTRSTGDDMVIPLIFGMCIGRIGCFLTGLDDHTYGTATTWITGVNFGDGITRHPTQLYEIAYLLLIGCCLIALKRSALRRAQPLPDGRLFQLFMTAYLLFRLLIDFIKPVEHAYAGLNSIQVACILALIYYFRLIQRTRHQPVLSEREDHHA